MKRPASARGRRYINYHGTSTELNDRIETRAVKLAFDGHAYRLAGIVAEEPDRPSAGRLRRGRRSPPRCWPCATAWCRPPSIVDEPDPECDLDYVPQIGRRLEYRIRRGQLHRLRQQEFGFSSQKRQQSYPLPRERDVPEGVRAVPSS